MVKQSIIDELLRNQEKALSSGNPPFAAVIECDNEIIASVSNRSRTSENPLHHAEIQAIQGVISDFGPRLLLRSHLYSTNEPCPMCIGACIWSGIPMVTYFLDQADIYRIRGWGRFMPAKEIASADDSGIRINGPIANLEMLKCHKAFWAADDNARKKHSIHLS